MKLAAAFTALCIATVQVTAVPAKRDSNAITDVEVLNFALTLEYLENAFYTEGLKKYGQDDFAKAGLPAWVRGRFEQIALHEATHVAFLQTALGSQAVKPCEYNFGDINIKAFVDFSGMVETVGASAYAGAAQLISSKDYLTAAASILATEARQASWVNSAVRKGAPWSTSFETPLDINQVYTIASGVITKCPSSNAALLPPNLKPFPALTIPANAAPGQKVHLTFQPPKDSKGPYFAAFISGLDTFFVPIKNNEVVIPKGLYGVVFAIITTDGKKVDDSVTIAGPAFLNFEFDSQGTVETLGL